MWSSSSLHGNGYPLFTSHSALRLSHDRVKSESALLKQLGVFTVHLELEISLSVTCSAKPRHDRDLTLKLMGETGVPGESHRLTPSYWQCPSVYM